MPRVRQFVSVVLGVLFLAATTQAKSTAESQQKPGFVRLDRVTASRPIPNGIEIHSGPAVLQILALRDDVLRLRVGPAGQLPEDASWAVLPASRTAAVNVTAETSATSIGFKTARLRVTIHRDPLELRADSALGVTGLVETTRTAKIALANSLGSGLVETPALVADPERAAQLLGWRTMRSDPENIIRSAGRWHAARLERDAHSDAPVSGRNAAAG